MGVCCHRSDGKSFQADIIVERTVLLEIKTIGR